MRWLDLIHARYHNDGLFFSQGFGEKELLKESLVKRESPSPAVLQLSRASESPQLLEFPSPRAEILPKESKICRALLLKPEHWTSETPLVLQLAATGDQGFETRQRLIAEPLLELGIGSVILENPFYGTRRPPDQVRTYLRTVSDLWALGLAVVAEARALLSGLRQEGFCHLGICGASLGGAMASHVGALCPFALAICSCIAPHSARPVYLDGVLSHYVDWDSLGGQEGREALGSQLDGSDLSLFPQPVRPDCALWLAAKHDAYVSPQSSRRAARLWPGSQLRWLNNSHVGATMFHRKTYIQCIADAFAQLRGAGHSMDHWLP